MENVPLQDLGKMTKESRGTSDVETNVCSNITPVRRKYKKVVNALCTFTGKEPVL